MTKLFVSMPMLALTGTLAAVFPACALANNGMYQIGFGIESVMMGGADVAVSRDAFASNNNPAGLTQLTGQTAEVEAVYIDAISVDHTDPYGNYRKPITNTSSGFGNMAYGRHFENTPYSAGVSLVVQGGLGWVYSGLNVNPAFGGGRDDASSLFTIIKLSPGFAWEVNDQLSLGVALGINYMAGKEELFPSTAGFPGFRFKDASGMGLNSKWGLQFRPAKDVTIGVTYGTQTSVPLKGGTLSYNDIATGSGVVRYDNAKLTGLRMPEELAVGISFRPTPPLLISVQDKWYNWSDAINKLQLTATNPRTAGATSVVIMPSSVDLTDQHAIAIGLAYDYDKDTLLMAGINHSSRAIPDQNLNPIFSLIQARHYTLGFSHKLDAEWQVGSGVQWFPLQVATYDSPVFGHATERHYAALFHFTLSRYW